MLHAVLSLKMFEGNQKKTQVDSKILGLRLTQGTKGYLVQKQPTEVFCKKSCS